MVRKMEGRCAFVTGAGSGLGRAISLELARHGAEIVAVDVDRTAVEETARLAAGLNRRVLPWTADVRDVEGIGQAVEAGLDAFGKLDALVNDAGVFGASVPLLEMRDGEWERVLGINLHGAFAVTRAVLPCILAAGGGTVVNVASTASHVVGGGGAAYTASKHALLGLTRHLAVDYGPLGVRVNAVCPGAIQTNLTKPIWEQHPEALKTYASVPAGRIGDPDEVARLVLFLSCPDSSFMYGSAVVADGGLMLT